MMALFDIYHREREWANVNGDPLLGTIEAETKEQAQKIANNLSFPNAYTGVIVINHPQNKE